MYPDTLNIHDVQFGMAHPAPNYPAWQDTVPGVGGIVTGMDAIPTGYGFYIQMNVGAWTGIKVYTGGYNYKIAPFNVALGDSVVVYGRIQESQNGTEIEGLDGVASTNDLVVRKVSSGNGLPPAYGGTCSILKENWLNPNAEQWEGCLVGSGGPLRVARNSLTVGMGTFNSFLLVDNVACPPGSIGPCDSLFVDGTTLTTFAPLSIGTTVYGVLGIYDQATRGYRIQLRDVNDIMLTPTGVAGDAPLLFALQGVRPNPALGEPLERALPTARDGARPARVI